MDRVHVGGEPGEDAPAWGAVEVADVEAHELAKKLAPEVEEHPLADPGKEVGLGVAEESLGPF